MHSVRSKCGFHRQTNRFPFFPPIAGNVWNKPSCVATWLTFRHMALVGDLQKSFLLEETPNRGRFVRNIVQIGPICQKHCPNRGWFAGDIVQIGPLCQKHCPNWGWFAGDIVQIRAGSSETLYKLGTISQKHWSNQGWFVRNSSTLGQIRWKHDESKQKLTIQTFCK
jgi:hypothetical protein